VALPKLFKFKFISERFNRNALIKPSELPVQEHGDLHKTTAKAVD